MFLVLWQDSTSKVGNTVGYDVYLFILSYHLFYISISIRIHDTVIKTSVYL